MIRISLEDKEYGVEDQEIGSIHYSVSLNNDATGYDVIDAIVKVMNIAEYHPETINKALRAALGLPEEEDE